MSKKVVILCDLFPYTNKESFLETEIKFYNTDVYIFPLNANIHMPKRNIPNNVTVFCPTYLSKNIKLIKKTMGYILAVFKKDTIIEMINLIKNNKLKIVTIKKLLNFVYNGYKNYKWIKKVLLDIGINKNDEIVFYSYWMYYHAYSAILLNIYFQNSKVYSRSHGYDLYEYRHKYNYIPFRDFILNNIDGVFTISNDGENYLKKRYPNLKEKITVARLGTLDYGFKEYIDKKDFKIVSCSWVVAVKRINIIIDALSLIDDIKITWIHYGDGELFNEIKQYAEIKLKNKNNITYIFKGAIPNNEILKDYFNNDYNLFINVSESEGIPVSIMEALSFGIPVIATDVGGTREIIQNNKCGFLLSPNIILYDLIKYIKKIYYMDDIEYNNMRNICRQLWKENYFAEYNYKKFINILLS
ncbi:glycosyltransferase [Caldicellulosiruptoraceae bacterium PP1]